MQETFFFGALAKGFIVAEGIVLADGYGFPLLDLLGEDGIGFQGQSVGRKMWDSSLKKQVEVAFPLRGVGSREAIDEVEAEVVETCLFGPNEAVSGVFRIVFAAQILQVVVEKALYPDAKSVDA